jgi:formylmethanofuran dehydrogenase subunit B
MAINYKSAQAVGVTTSTTVYNPTTSGVQATILGLLIANKTGSAVTASVTLNNGSSTTTNIVYNTSIPTGTSLDVLNSAKIVVPQNYVVAVSASGAVDVTLSVVEVS